jgi:uncharacterized protein YndB with AHSA1/START domain
LLGARDACRPRPVDRQTGQSFLSGGLESLHERIVERRMRWYLRAGDGLGVPIIIDKSVVVAAPRVEVWRAFTTEDGAQTFFAPRAKIGLELGGPYELFFDLEQPAGLRGGEGMRVLSFVPEEMLSFEWNAPPSLAAARAGACSFVVVGIADRDGATHVRLRHLGIERMQQAGEVEAYFRRAWDMVMCWLEHRFSAGPVDWNSPPRPSRSYDTDGAAS